MAITVEHKERAFGLKDELTCTPASLRGHIVNDHFSPSIVSLIGVARYDIELARFREIPLDWVARKAYEILEEDEFTAFQRFPKIPWRTGRHFFQWGDITSYRTMIVKNLIFIEELGLAPVDWDKVEVAFTDARSVTLDIEMDSNDVPFSPEGLAYRDTLKNSFLEIIPKNIQNIMKFLR